MTNDILHSVRVGGWFAWLSPTEFLCGNHSTWGCVYASIKQAHLYVEIFKVIFSSPSCFLYLKVEILLCKIKIYIPKTEGQ